MSGSAILTPAGAGDRGMSGMAVRASTDARGAA